MPDGLSIATRILEALVAGYVIAPEVLASARAEAGSDAAAGAMLLGSGAISADAIAAVLEDDLGVPRVDLASYAPDDDALERVTGALAREHRVLPMFEIEGMLTVAIGAAGDVFEIDSLAAAIGLEVEPVLADAPDVDAAIAQYYPAPVAPEPEPAPVAGPAPDIESTPVFFDGVPVVSDATDLEISAGDFFELEAETPIVVDAPEAVHEELAGEEPLAVEPAHVAEEPVAQTVEEVVSAQAQATSGIDLDVLAVADDRRLSVLVAQILEHAVEKGANRIHLLPYKNDFFLVFRIGGRLEKIASAPLSMEGPLIEGFKSFARLSQVPADLPALGRLHAEIAGRALVLTVSSVPTVAGQRLVVSLAPARPTPRDFLELGMSEAESRALQAMVERGRGILLVAAPVAGGRSSTYYALLSHAAQAGKTVYSVESSVEYEIPAVAQVLVNPGSPVGAASYFAAGMRQDTDVLAIDSMQSVEDVHLAIEAAGLGKLVIATFAGADIVAGVRRMLDLGAEPVSLASALTLGVGQRVVRTTCPSCASDEKNPLAAKIPGGTSGMTTRVGTGCPNCGKTGFAGATGIFEVLPFTDPVRAQIAAGASADKLTAAARAAGMRPMIASGFAKVRDGAVSVDELNRVLRFAV